MFGLVLHTAFPSLALSDTPEAVFRRGNENAARSSWDAALVEYAELDKQGVKAPSLYWNWAQAASAAGRKGEASWALRRAQELAPADSSLSRDLERLRGEMGLDPSEVSLGFLGDARLLARRFRFDLIAAILFLLSVAALWGTKPRTALSFGVFFAGLLLVLPLLGARGSDPRGVVIQKDAPLMDAPKNEALALANLREGEVVPILSEDGDFVRIQDASGARGFAHKTDVRKIGFGK